MASFNEVSNPSHYTEGREYEPRLVIEDWGLDFYLGNALKYISRAGRKGNAVIDLQKAIQNIEFEIDRLQKKEFASYNNGVVDSKAANAVSPNDLREVFLGFDMNNVFEKKGEDDDDK